MTNWNAQVSTNAEAALNVAGYSSAILMRSLIFCPKDVTGIYFPARQVSNVTSEAGSQTYGYDAAERVTNIVDGVAGTFTYDYNPYNGLVDTVEYPNGISCALDYDILDRLTEITWTGPSGTLHSLNYQYDATGMITGRVEECSSGMSTTVFSYDSIDRLTYGQNGLLSSAIYDDETLEFEYFDNDLLKVAENSEAAITNSYNSVNRLTNVVTVAGSVTSDVSYTYFPAGQVSNMTTEAGTVTFSYDAAERVTDIVDSVAGTFEHSYNTNNGLVQTVEYPNDVECSLDYDVMDRLTAISWTGPSGTLHSLSYQYDNAGMITNRVEESPAGTRSSAFTYDSLDRLTGETYSDGSGTVFDEVGYEYDLAGNRTNKTRNGVTVSFELGAGNRMTNWTAQVGTNAEAVMYVAGYSSEDIGTDPRYGEWTVNEEDAEVSGTNFWSTTVFSDLSQTSQTVIAAIGDEAGNVGRDTNTWTLTIITNAAYSFDDAGNVTEIAYNSNLMVRTLGWDDQYQLAAVSNGTSEVESYSYGPFGRRLTTTQGTNTIHHLYDGTHCIADVDGDGDVIRSYTYGPGVDNPLAMTVIGGETNTYYYLTDHLGSVLALTDEDGELVESYEYDAFGRIKVFDAEFEEISESAYGNRITFQGREYSRATGLYYFRARWCEPVTGRWLSKDPIGISGGLNQYVAFENNPVMYTDSTGLDPGDPPGLATLIGNAINNRVTAINEATGTVLADLYNRTGSRLGFEDRTDFGDQYAGLVDLVNSTETPAHPEGTPYIVGGLAVSACAVTTAAAVGAGPGVGRFLFGKGGLLNRGPNLRIGFGRKGGERVFRIAGDWVKKINSSGKIDLWKGGPL